jgi:hypothetical protein
MTFSVRNRPFGSETLTGIALPGGFFETALGTQNINAQFSTDSDVPVVEIYIESISDPNIVPTPKTNAVANLPAGASRLLSWQANFSSAMPGVHRVAFVMQSAAGRQRVIKKIFVTKVELNQNTGVFSALFPEGRMEAKFTEVLGPVVNPCCQGNHQPNTSNADNPIPRDLGGILVGKYTAGDTLCNPIRLIGGVDVVLAPTIPYEGSVSPLPFQDPSLKEVLGIIFIVLWFLALAALIVAIVSALVIMSSGGLIFVAAIGWDCCTVPVIAGIAFLALSGAAIIDAAVIALADYPDTFRRLQEANPPRANEVTQSESFRIRFDYVDGISPGKPVRVRAFGDYTRDTLDAAGNQQRYDAQFDETNTNTHVISRYEVEHPDILRVYQDKPFIVKGRFYDEAGQIIPSDRLYVRCYLEGQGALANRSYQFPLQDDGVYPDDAVNDGTFTGRWNFNNADRGDWHVYVVAQDVNLAQENMSPEEAAKFLGSQLLTNQLTINTKGGTCPLAPDGDVRVI